jgi:two-component system OmpR family sensor kinase
MPLAVAPGSAVDRARATRRWSCRCGTATACRCFRSQGTAAAPERRAPGFSTVQSPEGPWRVYSVLAQGQLIQVAQPLAQRDQLAASLAFSTILPWLVAAPLIGLFLWFAITRALRPLDRLADAVGTRSPRELRPLAAEGWPSELTPLVGALNALLGRLDAQLDAQRTVRRRRGARAAHAARGRPPAGAARRARARRARARRRARRVARRPQARRRASSSSCSRSRARTTRTPRRGASASTSPSSRATSSRRTPRSPAAKDVDLGAERLEPLAVDGDRASLATLLANLVDNAIRYTPRAATSTSRSSRATGAGDRRARRRPGIAAGERAQVFERFARGARATCPARDSGSRSSSGSRSDMARPVELATGAGGRGLEVVVRFAR